MKRILSLVLTLALVLSLFAGMSFASADEAAPRLEWMMGGDNTVTDDNLVVTELRKRTGVDIHFNYISSGDYNTKLNTLIAADTLPDIFSTGGQTAIDLRDAGKLLDYSGLLAENAPDIVATYQNGELEAMAVNSDGGIYGLVGLGSQIIENLIIRKDWLANVGMEVPTTLDELYEVMKAFTFNDPDGNGQNDTYGFVGTGSNTAYYENIFAAYGIPMGRMILLEDGTVTTYMKHENYLKAVEYFRRLYQEGIMDPDFATLTDMETFERLWNGACGMLGFRAVGITNNWYPGRYTFEVPENPEDIFAQVLLTSEVTGETVGAVAEHVGTTGCACAISAKCANPEAALKPIDYMYFTKEGQDLIYLGVDGVMFQWTDEANGKYERLGDYKDDTLHRAAGAFVYGAGFTVDNAENRTLNACTREMQAKEKEVALDYVVIPVTLDSQAEYGTTLGALQWEAFCNLIVTTGDVQAEYEEFLARWDEEGGQEYEEEATAWWAENHK